MEILGYKMSPLSVVVALVVGGVLLLWVRHRNICWRGVTKSGARLPNGSIGWPIIGETIGFLSNPLLYANSHVRRFGSIFMSSLFLEPTIVGTTPEFAKFVTSNPKLFAHGHPPGIEEVAPKAFVNKDGPSYMAFKKLFTKGMLPESLKTKVGVLEEIVLHHLASWEQQVAVNGRDAAIEVTFDTACYMILGARNISKSAEGRQILEDFKALNKCIFSAPVKLPGTAYSNGFKAKASLTKVFSSMYEERKKHKDFQSEDAFGLLIAAQTDEEAPKELKNLDDDTIAQNILAILFGAYETTATTFTWVLKMMNDHPDHFRKLQAEQEEILKDKGPSVEGPRLTWDDTKRMVAAKNFFQEIQRYVSIAPFLPRRTAEDVEYEGYLLPKGWKVLPLTSAIHHNPELYPDPSSFNPDRFNKATVKPLSYVVFGHGIRRCPGGEFTKLLTLIMIHHLTTSFAHKPAGPDRGAKYYGGLLMPVGAYPINVRRRN